MSTYRSTCGNGTAHLTYYRPAESLSFVWDGTLDHPIEVEHGGYGEPVIATIDPRPLMPADGPGSWGEVFAWFTRTCDEWADQR
jgi:hypothetical protein